MAPPWSPVIGWLRRHPLLVDGAFAAALVVAQVALYITGPPVEPDPEPDKAGGVIIAATLALTWRREHPLVVLAAIVAGEIILVLFGYEPGGVTFPLIVAAYAAGAYARARPAHVAAICLLVGDDQPLLRSGLPHDPRRRGRHRGGGRGGRWR